MAHPPARHAVGAVCGAAATTAVGSSVAASSVLVDYPILTAQAVRYGMGAVLLLAWIRLRHLRVPRLSRRDLVRLLALAAIGLAAFNVFLVAALRSAEPAAVGVVVGCVPLALALLGPLVSRRRVDARLVLAAVVVVAGAALVQGVGRTSAGGLALSLGALAAETAFTLIAVPALPRLGPAGVSTYACALASVQLGVVAVALDGGDAFRLPSTSEAAAVVYLAVVVTAAAFVLWYTAVSRLGPERAGLFGGLVPVAALVGGLVVGTSSLGAVKLAGTVVVGLGVTLGLRARRMPAPALAEPMPSAVDGSLMAEPMPPADREQGEA